MSDRIRDIDDLLLLLRGVRKVGNGSYTALCPGHRDTKPSLSISEADGRVLIQCFAGCKLVDVLKPLDLEPRDLFLNDDRFQSEHREIEAIYQYTDAANKPFEVIRTKPKGFYQRRSDGNSGYVNNLKGIVPTLYHQDKLMQATDSGKAVFIVEGEKDADRLWSLGLVATTNPMGAGKWLDAYAEALEGADLVIIPDNDNPGRKHASRVAVSCFGVADRIRILKLPDLNGCSVKDVSDWLEAGGGKEELQRLAAEAPEWVPESNITGKEAKVADGGAKETSFAINGDYLYEQIYSDGKSAFVECDTNTNKIRIITHIMQDEDKIIPQQGDEIRLGVIKLPSGVTEYGDTISLLREVEAHIYKYLDISAAFLKFAAYYILLSWVYDKFSTLPYLRSLGDTGTGKSRFLNVCGELCYKPTLASGCITPAPIYRMLKRWNGTIILDEADLRNSDEYNEVVTILNCGFERGRPVIRAVKDNPDKLQFLPTFGPKVFATRRRFQDPALEARCLTEIMQETTRDDIPATLPCRFYKEQETLRNKLLMFRLRNYNQISPEESLELDLSGIEPRLKQISACFASLFAGQPDVLSDYRTFIRNHQLELIEQRSATPTGQVVETLFQLTENVTDVTIVTPVTGERLIRVSSKDIADKVNMTPQVVGQILKTLGLQSKVVKVEGKSERCLIYDEAKLQTLRRRYIPDEDKKVTAVTMVTGLNKVEVALGMSIEDAVKLWRSRGAPIIHLGPGENCHDLVKLLSNANVGEYHLQVVGRWLQEKSGIADK